MPTTPVDAKLTLTENQENRLIYRIAVYYVTDLNYFMEDFKLLFNSFNPDHAGGDEYYLVISTVKSRGSYDLDPEQVKIIEEFEVAVPGSNPALYKYLKVLVCKGLKLAMDELSKAMDKRIATLNSN